MGGISQLMNLQEGQSISEIPGLTSFQEKKVEVEEFDDDD